MRVKVFVAQICTQIAQLYQSRKRGHLRPRHRRTKKEKCKRKEKTEFNADQGGDKQCPAPEFDDGRVQDIWY